MNAEPRVPEQTPHDLVVTVSGEGDFDMRSDSAWLVEVVTPAGSVVCMSLGDGGPLVAVDGETIWREARR